MNELEHTARAILSMCDSLGLELEHGHDNLIPERNASCLAKAALKAHAEWQREQGWPKPSENLAYLAAFKVRHGRETDGKEFDGQLWQWLRVGHEAMISAAHQQEE